MKIMLWCVGLLALVLVGGYIYDSNDSPTKRLEHDRKVCSQMYYGREPQTSACVNRRFDSDQEMMRKFRNG